jgi:hypothetical protein
MANLATSLLDFILDLLRDPDTAADFQADPQGTLAAAGLADVCPADVQNVRMVLEDTAPLGVGPTGLAHVAPVAPTVAAVTPVAATTTQVSPVTAPADADSGSVVEQLRYIQQTFTFDASTNIDARDSVWAGKDVYQLFGDDSVMAAGGSVAAGDDVEDVSVDHSTNIEDSFNIDDSFNPENSGNTVEGDGNAVGRGNDVENTDNSIEVEDSTGVNVGDDNVGGDASLDASTNVEDSGNTEVSDFLNGNVVAVDDAIAAADNEVDL